MTLIPSDSKRLTLARDGSAPGGFVRGGPGGRRRGVGRLTGRQCPKTTREGHRWRSEAAERDDHTEASGRRRTKGKKKSDVTDRIAMAVRGLFGQLKIQLSETDDEDMEYEKRTG